MKRRKRRLNPIYWIIQFLGGLVALGSLWYIAAFENGAMQYSVYGGYKREQDAKRQATIHKIKIEEIRR